MSAKHDAATRLAEIGYRVFPCATAGKMPATPHGCLDATSDPDQIDQWWEANPDYNVGLSTDTLVVIDIDVAKDGSPNEWLKTLSEEQVDELAKAPCAITPRGGQHLVFRQEAGLRNTTSAIADRVDTRADGGYILVAPSRTENGGYQWVPGRELDCGRDQLPEVPQWLLDALEAKRAAVKTLAESVADGGDMIPEGQRNHTLASLGGSLRRMGLSQAAVEASLLATNQERCAIPLPDDEVRQIAKSVSRYEPDQIAQAVAEDTASTVFEQTPEVVVDEAPYDPVPDPGKFPSHLVDVPGLMGELIAHNLATAHKRQPELALAGAIALMATLTGRTVSDEMGGRANLYLIGLCGSGGGKNHARKLNKEILAMAGLEARIGSEKISSEQGIHSALVSCPVQLMQIDELGGWLETASDLRGGPFLRAAMDCLMTMYADAGTIVKGGAVSDISRVKIVKQPHLVIYGTSVPHRVWDALTERNTNDGLLSRMILIEATDDDPPQQHAISIEVPESIIEQARWWGNYEPGGNLGDNAWAKPRRLVTTTDAMGLYDQLRAEIAVDIARWPHIGGVFARIEENTRKLALLYTLSADRDADEVGVCAASWACQMTLHSYRRLAHMSDLRISRNPYERLYKRVLRFIREADGWTCTKTKLLRTFTDTKAYDLTEMLARMVESGVIVVRSVKTKSRPATAYRLTEDGGCT